MMKLTELALLSLDIVACREGEGGKWRERERGREREAMRGREREREGDGGRGREREGERGSERERDVGRLYAAVSFFRFLRVIVFFLRDVSLYACLTGRNMYQNLRM